MRTGQHIPPHHGSEEKTLRRATGESEVLPPLLSMFAREKETNKVNVG